MSKLDINFSDLEVSPASFPDLQPARRLIVLVPDSEVDTTLLARKIWELANALESRVQFLGLSRDAAHEPRLRRQIINLSAMVGDGNHISVESKIEFGTNWLNAVKSEWREGDVIVCFTEQRAGFTRRPLSQILESNLNATIYLLTGFHQQEDRLRSSWIFNGIAWAGSILIIFSFSWLQIKLTQSPQDWEYRALLYISLIIETGSIWMWNNLFEKYTGK
ncbi:MAG: hypothetical protein IPN58_06260 [Anaerolineales bacterium]|nr:hypothetical protein [Anaerolineales bacterium]